MDWKQIKCNATFAGYATIWLVGATALSWAVVEGTEAVFVYVAGII